MKKLLLIYLFSFFIFHFSFAQPKYGWKNLSVNLPDFPFDTVIINGFAGAGRNTLLKYTQLTSEEEHGDGEVGMGGGVEMFPNPTSGKVTVQSLKFTIWVNKIELVDLSGKVVSALFEERSGLNVMEFDIIHLPSGLYFVKISLSDYVIFRKIFKL